MKKAIPAIFLRFALTLFVTEPSLADQEVKLGLQNLSSYRVFFVGMDNGFFKAKGLRVKR